MWREKSSQARQAAVVGQNLIKVAISETFRECEARTKLKGIMMKPPMC